MSESSITYVNMNNYPKTGDVRLINETSRETQIEQQFKELENEVEFLLKAVCDLGTRLEPVSTPNCPKPCEEQKEPPSSVPLADRLRRNVRAVRNSREQISDIIGRLEL
jgi:hypothetical protein